MLGQGSQCDDLGSYLAWVNHLVLNQQVMHSLKYTLAKHAQHGQTKQAQQCFFIQARKPYTVLSLMDS